jgi:hypothetical protein
MWSSWVKEMGTTQVMYITKLNDGPKKVKKTFSMILEGVFEMVWWRGRKWNQIKKDFWSWSIFLLSNIDFSFYLKRLLELFFFLLFSISFHAPSLKASGVLMIYEEKFTSSKTSSQMASIYW